MVKQDDKVGWKLPFLLSSHHLSTKGLFVRTAPYLIIIELKIDSLTGSR